MSTYISCKDTAKLIRSALKESFPKIKFSVRSSVYSGGASINVSWTDGPTKSQVEDVINRFEGSYFSGMEDYKGNRYHMLDGARVSFGADFIFTERNYSDSTIQKAIDAISIKYRVNWLDAGIVKPSVDDFKRGRCWNLRDPAMHVNGLHSVQADINENLSMRCYVLTQPSETLKRVHFLGDEGYGQSSFGMVHLTAVD